MSARAMAPQQQAQVLDVKRRLMGSLPAYRQLADETGVGDTILIELVVHAARAHPDLDPFGHVLELWCRYKSSGQWPRVTFMEFVVQVEP